jgi:hypothetical protein
MSYLAEHKPHFGVAYFVRHSDLEPGDVVSFSYKGIQRWAFILHPDWGGKMHALTLELTPRQTIIDQVVDIMYETDAPQDMYEWEVYKVAKTFDSYRTYFVDEMRGTRRLPYYLTDKPKLKKNASNTI